MHRCQAGSGFGVSHVEEARLGAKGSFEAEPVTTGQAILAIARAKEAH